MLDFNTKKEILRSLRIKRSKNKLLWLPCVIAELFVKLWYAVVCSIDMALSDKNGNFLGMKRSKSEKVKSRKKDDIVNVRKPFMCRILSAVLAFSFVFMMIPELGVMDLSVFAENEDITETVIFGNETYTYDTTKSTETSSYYYKNLEREYTKTKSVDITSWYVGYGAVRVDWAEPVIDDKFISTIEVIGYNVYLYQKNVLCGTKYIAEPGTSCEFTSEDDITIKPNVSTMVRVEPVFNITLYKLSYDTENNKSIAPTDQTRREVGKNVDKDVETLNASMGIPAVEDFDNDQQLVVWSQVTQNYGYPSDIGALPDGYIVYRRTYDAAKNTQGEWKQLATVPYNRYLTQDVADEHGYTDDITNKLYCSDGSVVKGAIYEYYVMAYRNVIGSSAYDPSDPFTISSGNADAHSYKRLYTTPNAPLNVTVKSNGKNTLNVSWKAGVGQNTGYVLYRSDVFYSIDMLKELSPNGDDTQNPYYNSKTGSLDYTRYIRDKAEEMVRVSTNTLSYSDSDEDLVNTKTYYYYVVAYLDTGDGNYIYSAPTSASGKLNSSLYPPQGLIAKPSDGRIDVSWDKVDDADGYKLHITKIQNNDGSTTGCGTTTVVYLTKNSYPHVGLYNNEVYSYKVQAYINATSSSNDTEEDYDKVLSDFSDTRTATVGELLDIPQDLTLKTSDGKIDVSWSKVNGAKGYELYYKCNDGTAKKVDVSNTKFNHTRLNNGDVYTYYVRAYKIVNGVTVYGEYSNEVSIMVGDTLDAPKDFAAEAEGDTVDLSWSKAKGAEGYIIYANINGQFQEIDVSKTKYAHTGLKNGDTITYYLKAYKTVNGVRVFSDSTKSITVTIDNSLSSPKDFVAEFENGVVKLSWSKVTGAEGYILYASCNGKNHEIDLSKTKYDHKDVLNGEKWTYYVKAYKYVNGEKVFSEPTKSITVTIGDFLSAPKDFIAETEDGVVDLSWSKVTGAEGYILYAYCNGKYYEIDLSKTKYEHKDVLNGDEWTYYVKAYKTVNGEKVFSEPTKSITVTVGESLNSVVDLMATAGNRQIDLSWSKVKGAEGYIVYLLDEDTQEYEPLTVTSKLKYSHTGLKNGKAYTYMVAAFKNVNGERQIGEYSMEVTAIPTSGSSTDVDRVLNIKGTTPYGISHSEYISAKANHDAFSESVDVYITTNQESTKAVKDVLKNYANGLSSFIIYPFDISVYKENTLIKVDPEDGYTVTMTIPIPDKLIAYRDYLTVVHINEDAVEEVDETAWYEIQDQRLEVLPCAILDIDNVWCVQFVCSSFSPYAFVIYKDHINDVSAGGGVADGSFAGTFNSGVLLLTALPDILPNNKKLSVVEGKKRYRIKKVTKK